MKKNFRFTTTEIINCNMNLKTKQKNIDLPVTDGKKIANSRVNELVKSATIPPILLSSGAFIYGK